MRDSMYLTSSDLVVATPTFGEGCAWKGRELHKPKQKKNSNEYFEKNVSPTIENEGIGGYDVFSNVSGLASQQIPKFGTQRKHQTEVDLDISELRENATQSLKQSSIYQNQHIKQPKQNYYQLQCDSSSLQALSLNHLDSLEQSGSTSATLKHPKISKKSPLFEKFGQKKNSSQEFQQLILLQRSSPNDSQHSNQNSKQAYNIYPLQTGQKFSKLESSRSFEESSSNMQFRDSNGQNNNQYQRYFPFSIDSSLDVTPEKGKSPNLSHIRAFSQQKSDSLPCSLPESARFTLESQQNTHMQGVQSFRNNQNIINLNLNQVQLHQINNSNNNSMQQVFLPSIDIPSSQSMSPTKLNPSPQRILQSNQGSGEIIPFNCDEKFQLSQDKTVKELNNNMDKSDYSSIQKAIFPAQIKNIIPSTSKKPNSRNITLISNESPNGITQIRRAQEVDKFGQMKLTNQLPTPIGEKQTIQLNLCSGDRLESVLVKKKPPTHKQTDKSRESTRTSRGVSSILTPPNSAVTTTSNPSKITQRTQSNNGSPLDRNEVPLLEMARFCSEEIETKKPNSQQHTSNPLSPNIIQQNQNQKPPNIDGQQLQPQKGIISLRKTLYGNVSASEKSKRSSSTKNQTKLHFFPHPPLSSKDSTKIDSYIKPTGKPPILTNLSNNVSPTNCQLEPIKLSIHPYSADNSDFDNLYKPQVTVRSNRSNATDNICNKIRGMFIKQKEMYESRSGSTSAREREQEQRELMKELSYTLEDLKQVSLNASAVKKRNSFSHQNKLSLN